MKIIVCGLGRCGSSLTMQMLKAGGIACLGDAPAFEPEEVNIHRDMAKLLPKLEGMAAKILDPQRSKWPHCSGLRVIWLDRDRKEQAKSQLKMVETFGGVKIPRRSRAIRAMAASLIPDREECMDLFADIGAIVHKLRFEDILANPNEAARGIISFLELSINPAKMASAVRERGHECQPDMAMEYLLVEEAMAC